MEFYSNLIYSNLLITLRSGNSLGCCYCPHTAEGETDPHSGTWGHWRQFQWALCGGARMGMPHCHTLLLHHWAPLRPRASYPAPRHSGFPPNVSPTTSPPLLLFHESAAAIGTPHLYAAETCRMCVLVWKPVKSIYGPNCQFSWVTDIQCFDYPA